MIRINHLFQYHDLLAQRHFVPFSGDASALLKRSAMSSSPRFELKTRASFPDSSLTDRPPTPRKRPKLTGPNYFKIILNSDSESEAGPGPSSSRHAAAVAHRRGERGPADPDSDPWPIPDLGAPKIVGESDAEYLRRQLCLHISVPVDLWAIADPPDGQKPFASLPTLVKLAIHGSAEKRLTLQGICDALIERFSWFHAHQYEEAWKNSVRHNLSLNKVFRKIPRNVTAHLGKGCYWQLDLSDGEGHKRPRKRGRKKPPPDAAAVAGSDLEHEHEREPEPEPEPEHEQDECDSGGGRSESPQGTPQAVLSALKTLDDPSPHVVDSLLLFQPYAHPSKEPERPPDRRGKKPGKD